MLVWFSSDHLVEVHGSKPDEFLTCGACDKTFFDPSSLKRHRATFHATVTFSCDVCSATFKTKSTLAKHHAMAHSESGKRPFPCGLCNLNFKSNASLKVRIAS